MVRRVSGWLLVLLLLAGVTGASRASADAASAPNVLIVLVDDQGMGDFSCHGNPVLKTPELDRLHGECVRLTNFHVAPMCTPTRGQLLTGQDAVRNGATSVTAGRSFIRVGTPTMAEIFAAAGYKTGIFGKWHLGDNYPHRPMDRGFQEAMYHEGWGFSGVAEFENTLFNGTYLHNGETKSFTGHCTDFWFDQAKEWMRKQQAANEPFLCYLPLNAAHAPYVVDEKYSAPYVGKGPAEYYGMIAQIDENIGRLDRFLSESGLRDNTILIYMTDNGATVGEEIFNAGLRGGKTTYYEGGHRVPCWIRWPAGDWDEPRDISAPTQVQDILPTLLEACGVKPPANARFDGVSLAGLLDGSQQTLPDRMLVVQYSLRTLDKWECCVIWNQWRLVEGKELYDVDADLAQTRDIAAQQSDIVEKMRAHYERWWAELEPLAKQYVCTTIGSEKQPIVELTSADWQDIWCDNVGHICNATGGPRGGPWHINVERAGTYKIVTRRWAKELDLPLTSGDVLKPFGDKMLPGKALPIAAGRVVGAGQEISAVASEDGKTVTFYIELPAGRTTLQAWFIHPFGPDLIGAYYADVEYLD